MDEKFLVIFLKQEFKLYTKNSLLFLHRDDVKSYFYYLGTYYCLFFYTVNDH
jgi:hypothetical protein